MSKRDELCLEIRRLKKAKQETSSKYLKTDYDKAIRRLIRELKTYDFYMRGQNNDIDRGNKKDRVS